MRWFHSLEKPFCESPQCSCRTGVYAQVMNNPERNEEARLRAIKIMNESAYLTHAFYKQHFPQRAQ